MPLYFRFCLITILLIAIAQIGSGFFCLNTIYPRPVCTTAKSTYEPLTDGWTNARYYYLDPFSVECLDFLRQWCCTDWKLYYSPTEEQRREHLGIGRWCIGVDDTDPCHPSGEIPRIPMPFKKRKRFYLDELEIPDELETPDELKIPDELETAQFQRGHICGGA